MNDLLSLAQAGPVAILLVGMALFLRGFLSKEPAVVPGWLYRQEREQRIAGDARNLELTAALTALAKKATPDGNGHPSPDA